MNIEEYKKLDKIDAIHWFYKGKRQIARYWINKYSELSHDDILLDVGCGTGRFLQEWHLTKSFGIDFSFESLYLVRNKDLHNILRGEITSLPFKENSIAVVVALDVLEHCYNDKDAIYSLISILRPGGILFITVPALPCLWSDWDESLHHFRRYTKYTLNEIIPQNTELLRLSYFNEISLVPALFIRNIRKFIIKNSASNRLEDIVPPLFLNRLLYKLLVILSCNYRYKPFAGLSLMMILKKC